MKLIGWDPNHGRDDVWFTGTVSSLTAVTVPEPALPAVLCFASAGWFAHRRRRVARA